MANKLVGNYDELLTRCFDVDENSLQHLNLERCKVVIIQQCLESLISRKFCVKYLLLSNILYDVLMYLSIKAFILYWFSKINFTSIPPRPVKISAKNASNKMTCSRIDALHKKLSNLDFSLPPNFEVRFYFSSHQLFLEIWFQVYNAVLNQIGFLGKTPLCFPRYMFQALQTTTIKVGQFLHVFHHGYKYSGNYFRDCPLTATNGQRPVHFGAGWPETGAQSGGRGSAAEKWLQISKGPS